jgi:hypothetical protein
MADAQVGYLNRQCAGKDRQATCRLNRDQSVEHPDLKLGHEQEKKILESSSHDPDLVMRRSGS